MTPCGFKYLIIRMPVFELRHDARCYPSCYPQGLQGASNSMNAGGAARVFPFREVATASSCFALDGATTSAERMRPWFSSDPQSRVQGRRCRRLCAQRPRTSMSASSTARSSVASRRPADRPSRWGSTTVVCSTRTRVCCCSSVMVGRKLAGRALVEVGATRMVLRSRNSSAWTTTAYPAPRFPCPRTLRGAGRWNISPRTTSVGEWRCERGELFADQPHLLAVVLVVREATHLFADGRADPTPRCRLPQRGPHSFRVAQPAGSDDLERRCGGIVEPDVKGTSHPPTVAQIMLRLDGRVRSRRRPRLLGSPSATTCATAWRTEGSPGT